MRESRTYGSVRGLRLRGLSLLDCMRTEQTCKVNHKANTKENVDGVIG